jgi:hypothetical protein
MDHIISTIKGAAILVTGSGSPQACETSRLQHLLQSRFTDGGVVVSLTRRPAALDPQEDSWYCFLLEAEWTPGPSGAGRAGSVKTPDFSSFCRAPAVV